MTYAISNDAAHRYERDETREPVAQQDETLFDSDGVSDESVEPSFPLDDIPADDPRIEDFPAASFDREHPLTLEQEQRAFALRTAKEILRVPTGFAKSNELDVNEVLALAQYVLFGIPASHHDAHAGHNHGQELDETDLPSPVKKVLSDLRAKIAERGYGDKVVVSLTDQGIALHGTKDIDPDVINQIAQEVLHAADAEAERNAADIPQPGQYL